MTKKKMLIITGIIIGFLIVGSILFINRQRIFPQKETQKTTEVSVTPSPKEELITWDDPAGFSFQYPKGLTVDKHDEDQDNYAHIEFTNPSHKGRIIIWAKDTTAATITEWLKNEKSLKGTVSVDTTLGKNEAKKVMMKEPKKQITATLDEDIVVYIEAELEDEEFWQGVNDTIVSSFKFGTSSTDETGGGTSGEVPQVEADEEESVE